MSTSPKPTLLKRLAGFLETHPAPTQAEIASGIAGFNPGSIKNLVRKLERLGALERNGHVYQRTDDWERVFAIKSKGTRSERTLKVSDAELQAHSALGLSQKQIAVALGVSKPTVQNYYRRLRSQVAAPEGYEPVKVFQARHQLRRRRVDEFLTQHQLQVKWHLGERWIPTDVTYTPPHRKRSNSGLQRLTQSLHDQILSALPQLEQRPRQLLEGWLSKGTLHAAAAPLGIGPERARQLLRKYLTHLQTTGAFPTSSVRRTATIKSVIARRKPSKAMAAISAKLNAMPARYLEFALGRVTSEQHGRWVRLMLDGQTPAEIARAEGLHSYAALMYGIQTALKQLESGLTIWNSALAHEK